MTYHRCPFCLRRMAIYKFDRRGGAPNPTCLDCAREGRKR